MAKNEAMPFLTAVANEFEVPLNEVVWESNKGYDHIEDNIYKIPTRVDGTKYHIRYDMDTNTVLEYHQNSD